MNRLYAVVWFTARTLLKALFGLRPVGDHHIPQKGPAIIAANHQSYFDPPVAATVIRREMHFFAKRELFDVPILNWLLARLNVIPVQRGRYDPRALSRVREALAGNGIVLIFPEGTRGNGREFLPPKPGVGLIAKQAKVPIVPAYLYRTDKLVGAFLARRRVRVFFGAPISPEDQQRFPDTKEGYRSLAEYVMEHIGRLKVVALSG